MDHPKDWSKVVTLGRWLGHMEVNNEVFIVNWTVKYCLLHRGGLVKEVVSLGGSSVHVCYI